MKKVFAVVVVLILCISTCAYADEITDTFGGFSYTLPDGFFLLPDDYAGLGDSSRVYSFSQLDVCPWVWSAVIFSASELSSTSLSGELSLICSLFQRRDVIDAGLFLADGHYVSYFRWDDDGDLCDCIVALGGDDQAIIVYIDLEDDALLDLQGELRDRIASSIRYTGQ